MKTRVYSATVFFTLCTIMISHLCSANESHAEKQSTPAVQEGAKPKLILPPARADFLKDGVVYIPFRVENMTILPVYTEIHGEGIAKVQPQIGHLHVMVDDNGWAWVHASADPIYFSPLAPGSHTVKVELSDTSHRIIETQTIKLMIP
jgi:hypothetical protein